MGLITDKKLAPGIRFFGVREDSLKTNRVTAAILLPLREDTAAQNAIVPFILKSCGRQYPDYTSLRQYLAMLYGAELSASSARLGDCQLLTLSVSAVDNRFALDGGNIMLECANLLISLLCDPLTDSNGVFDGSAVEARKRILSEKILSEINDKRKYARQRTTQIMSEGGAYGVNPLGTVENVRAITPETATQSWKNMLSCGSIAFTVTGASDPSCCLELFEQAVGGLNRNYTEFPLVSRFVGGGEQKNVTERMEVVQSKLVMGFEGGANAFEGNSNALRLMTALFGGTPHSLLFLNVREKLSLCYYCAAQYDRIKGVLMVDSGLEEHNVQNAHSEILNQLDRIKKGDFTDEDLESAKLSIAGSFRSIADSSASLEMYYLGRIWENKAIASPDSEAKELEKISRNQIIDVAQGVVLDTCYLLAGEENSNEQ